MKKASSKSILIGNGININFGGKAYTNDYIIKRILLMHVRTDMICFLTVKLVETRLQVFLSDWLHGQMLFLTENMML